MVYVVGSVFMVGAFVMALAFFLRYLRTRWTATLEGKYSMTFSVVLLLATGLGTAALLVDRTHYAWLYGRAVLWGLIFMVLVWRFVLLMRGQRAKRLREEAETVEAPVGR